MAYEQRDMSGALFKNNRREQPKHPDYRGDALIDGREYRLSAWIKEGQTGKFMSLSFTPKEDGKATRYPPKEEKRPVARSMAEDMDDQIPFLMEWR